MQLPGPAGALEAAIDEPAISTGRYAILCHPHPQYGGSMHDVVLDCLAQALRDAGVGCLKFNFRGVGRSEGAHYDAHEGAQKGAQKGAQESAQKGAQESAQDGATGEVADLFAVADWLREARSPRSLLLGGYSFGANVVWQALARGMQAERALLIAPPIGAMQFPEFTPACPVDVFAGDADQFIDAAALDAWRGIHLHRLSGADHFFTGQWQLLRETISGVLR